MTKQNTSQVLSRSGSANEKNNRNMSLKNNGRSLIFDAGPVISFALNGLLGIFERLKVEYKGDFVICDSVREELIERPLKSKKFKFEAMRILNLFDNGIFKQVNSEEVNDLAEELMDLANRSFSVNGRHMQIVHMGEIESLAFGIKNGCDAIVVDERTTTLLVEDPEKIVERFKRRGINTKPDHEKIRAFREKTSGINIIRSVELIMIAYEKGLLDYLMPKSLNSKREFIDGILWALKLNGCSVSRAEISAITEMELMQTK